MILSEEFFIVDTVLKKNVKKNRTDWILKICFFLKTAGTNK